MLREKPWQSRLRLRVIASEAWQSHFVITLLKGDSHVKSLRVFPRNDNMGCVAVAPTLGMTEWCVAVALTLGETEWCVAVAKTLGMTVR